MWLRLVASDPHHGPVFRRTVQLGVGIDTRKRYGVALTHGKGSDSPANMRV
jgi:hypothetical protein